MKQTNVSHIDSSLIDYRRAGLLPLPALVGSVSRTSQRQQSENEVAFTHKRFSDEDAITMPEALR